MATQARRELEESASRIQQCGIGSRDVHISALNDLVRAVTHASSGRVAPSDELLQDLEPKLLILQFLCELHAKKKIQRRRVVATLSTLLQVTEWAAVVKTDQALLDTLPEELQENFRPETKPADPPEPDAVFLSPEGDSECISQEPKCLKLLTEAEGAIGLIGFSAADSDKAIAAFELFRKAVTWISTSKQSENVEVLENLEAKAQVLEFLADFYDRKRRYRARVSETMMRLLDLQSWRDAALADKSLHAAVRDLMVTDDIKESRRDTFICAASRGGLLDLAAAQHTAMANGSVGILYVRILEAVDLEGAVPSQAMPDKVEEGNENSDEVISPRKVADSVLSPFVRVRLGTRSKRTYIATGSKTTTWENDPFLFDVPSFDAVATIQVLDSDIVVDRALGRLDVCVSDATIQDRAPDRFCWELHELWEPARYPLQEVATGQLELELVFFPNDVQAFHASQLQKKPLPLTLSCWSAACAMAQRGFAWLRQSASPVAAPGQRPLIERRM
eukprot:TRINITY_DN70936_c0_g1_i1.p1 TRINITY_DN70936_c0_g1~~TRINITY_DN70936_c0_g1_i1.p1  ORF type:complete len:506 (-),score=99.42 TRINITY_DN70936_c0_g1_i1:127-1644(-)